MGQGVEGLRSTRRMQGTAEATISLSKWNSGGLAAGCEMLKSL